jgi:methanogenic corrinoid protein MtbC1
MEESGRIDTGVSWGPAEQAAIDRCLSVPGLSDRNLQKGQSLPLSRTIETEIIPRLMLVHLPRPESQAGDAETPPTPSDVADFTRIVLEDHLDVVMARVEAFRMEGYAIECLLLHLVAPTARLLGEMWEADLCTFGDVTIGLSRLQQVLRELSAPFENEASTATVGRIMLAAVPGEQHSLGVAMLESFFRRVGWEVYGGPSCTRAELVTLARDEWLDVIGLSLSSDVLLKNVRPTIQALRRASRNPALFVFVGGRYFLDHPDRAGEVGADATASDAPDALRRANSSLGFARARC